MIEFIIIETDGSVHIGSDKVREKERLKIVQRVKASSR